MRGESFKSWLIAKASRTTLLVLFATSCGFNHAAGMDEVREHLRRSEAAERRGDFVEASEEVKVAAKLSREIDWKDGVLTSELRLARLHVVEGRIEDAERTYIDLKEFCLTRGCDNLGLVYDGLFFLAVYEFKDLERADRLIDELISQRAHLESDRPLSARIGEYSRMLRGAGFSKEADRLDERRRVLD